MTKEAEGKKEDRKLDKQKPKEETSPTEFLKLAKEEELGYYIRYTDPFLGSASPMGTYAAAASLVTPGVAAPFEVFPVFPEVERLENEIAELRKGNRSLAQDIAAKTKAEQEIKEEIEKLNKNAEELTKKQRLMHLLSRVNENAQKKLLESEEFRKLFEQKTPCKAIIIAIDIRRSTELMLKARAPELYANFIISLCTQLKQIIVDNYGVFDKFTGDGILAFFPEFYSGEDAAYRAIKAADECQSCFSKHYENNRHCFTSILKDVGLGIGIDYGESYLVNIQDWLTVIGTPVVYACRMSGAEAGKTLLNQQAYEVTSHKFGEYVNFQESELDVKHEGRTLTYIATLGKKPYEPKPPDWLSKSVAK